MTKHKRPEIGTVLYVLQEVIPYEGNTIFGIFLDLENAKRDRPGRWREDPRHPGEWNTRSDRDSNTFKPFFTIHKEVLR